MDKVRKRTTIYDIAAYCDVSVATVSRVLSHAAYPVSEETKQLVLDAARTLRYTPNLLGKSLKTRSCRDIGVIVPNLTNYCYAALLQGVYDRAAESGYNVILCNSHRDPTAEQKNVELLLQKQVAGIIIASISAGAVQYALDYGLRVVAVEQAVSAPCGKVQLDFTRGAQLAAEHLLALGHRRIGFLGAPLDRSSRTQMLDGYLRAHRARGLEPDERLILLSADRPESDQGAVFEFENGRRQIDRFLELEQPPTAYLALNDMTALSAMQRLQARGLRVPEDASVVGFDNIPFSETSLPMLTTVDQRSEEMGALAAERLIAGVEQPEKPYEQLLIEPKLIVRGSTGACASR